MEPDKKTIARKIPMTDTHWGRNDRHTLGFG